jgi:hypothetical protein
MCTLKRSAVVVICTLLCAGFLFAQSAPPEAKPRSAGASDRAAIETTRVETPARINQRPLSSETILERLAALEARITALQEKCDWYEYELQKVKGLPGKVQALEDRHAESLKQLDQFQVVRNTRQLNPSERKETAELISQRAKVIEARMSQLIRNQSQMLRIQQFQAARQEPKQQEVLYGP